MNSESPGEVFFATFTDVANGVFVDALERAYESACELHDPKRGSNEVTFGFNLYHFAVHELCREAREESASFVVRSRQPTFRLEAGEFELACHRVGTSERDPISESFPKNEGAACRMVEDQLWLPNVPKGAALADARKLVLAHMGNTEDGMRAVYLCIPAKSEDDKITEWAYSKCIWRADDATTFVPDMSTLAPEEEIKPAVVKLREKKESNAEEG